jgi:hypothetical protein
LKAVSVLDPSTIKRSGHTGPVSMHLIRPALVIDTDNVMVLSVDDMTLFLLKQRLKPDDDPEHSLQ